MPTMAEVFNRFADEYQEHRLLSFEQQKLIRDIRQCRTYVLGGHVTACTTCGHIKVHYNSCGNRGCPGCQGVNKEKWILEREYDLLPVKYFHVVFTLPGQLRSICYQNKKLTLEGKIAHLKQAHDFWLLKKKLYEINWVVFTKEPFKKPDSVIEYLARYTHKIAISNYRIKAISESDVTFTYLDRANNNKKEIVTLTADKFITRFLLHVLPKGFCKIRHYGFLSTRLKQHYMPLIRKSLGMEVQEPKPKYRVKDVLQITRGIDPDLCLECKEGVMVCIQELPILRGSPNFRKCS